MSHRRQAADTNRRMVLTSSPEKQLIVECAANVPNCGSWRATALPVRIECLTSEPFDAAEGSTHETRPTD